MIIEKLYGDFKKLNAFIIDSFTNEVKEYERVEKVTSSGEIKNKKQVQIAPLESAYEQKQGSPSIHLNSWAADEFYQYGKIYYDEARRILQNLPKLPSKFEQNNNLTEENGNRISPDQLIEQLTDWLNNLIKLSPLIANQFALRRFLIDEQQQRKSSLLDLEKGRDSSGHNTSNKQASLNDSMVEEDFLNADMYSADRTDSFQ